MALRFTFRHLVKGAAPTFGVALTRNAGSMVANARISLLPRSTLLQTRKEIFGINSNQARNYANLPQHTRVGLPACNNSMTVGTIVCWHKKEGDKLHEGDLICEIETDKSVAGYEAKEEGYLAKIVIPAGTKGVPLGKLICILVENEADVAAFKNYTGE